MENFRIESLEINKIGAFEHIKMDFPKKTDPDKAEIHILTGENGTGKTTILMLLTNVADNSNEGDIFKRLQHSNSENPNKFSIQYGNKKGMTRLIMQGYYEYPKAEALQYSEPLNSVTPVNNVFFAYSNNRYAGVYSNIFNENYGFNPFKNALRFDKTSETTSFSNWILTTKTRALVAKDNGNNDEAKSYTQALKEIEKALSEITGQEIEFVLGSRPTLYIALNVDGIELNIDILPDGLKSIVAWLGDLLMRIENINWIDKTKISIHQNIILFLDEIEVHLHPAWQRKILPVVQKLFKNAQIFISTHSPFVVGSVDGAWVHKLKKDGAYAVLDGEPVLSEDGKSVRRILDETFGINQQYGVDVEKDLEEFRKIRQQIMMGNEYNSDEFNKLVKHLASQSTELEQMMGMEMNQLKRITQKELV
jgi:predicted ATP-binding protein involved in virulence